MQLRKKPTAPKQARKRTTPAVATPAVIDLHERGERDFERLASMLTDRGKPEWLRLRWVLDQILRRLETPHVGRALREWARALATNGTPADVDVAAAIVAAFELDLMPSAERAKLVNLARKRQKNSIGAVRANPHKVRMALVTAAREEGDPGARGFDWRSMYLLADVENFFPALIRVEGCVVPLSEEARDMLVRRVYSATLGKSDPDAVLRSALHTVGATTAEVAKLFAFRRQERSRPTRRKARV